MLQNATPLRKSAPGHPNISDEHVLRSSSHAPCLPLVLEMLQSRHVLLTFDKVHNPLPLPREITSEHPKAVRTHSAFNSLTSKRASRHNSVHFFDMSTSKSGPRPQFLAFLTLKCASRHSCVHFCDMSTSKSGPNMACFNLFDLDMCFERQQRALFPHLNFQKWSDTAAFFTF